MGQLQKPSKEYQKERLLTVIGSTPQRKLGMFNPVLHRSRKWILMFRNSAEIVRWVAESK
jgi:hypothetical protein